MKGIALHFNGRSLADWWSGGRQSRLPALVAACEGHHLRGAALLNARVCLWCACLWCFLATFPTTAVEWAGLPLLGASIVGARRIWSVAWRTLVTPEFVLAAAFSLWQFVTLLWSNDPRLGAGQAGACRWLWSIVLLAPVMAHRRALILALVLGFLAGNVSQFLHAIGTHFDIASITWSRQPGRNSGWWDPVVGGSVLVAALGLHLPAAIAGRGASLAAGLVGSAITIVAILATGTRGAMLAAGALVLVVTILALARTKPRAGILIRVGIAALLVAGAAWLAWPRIGPAIETRIETGRAEVIAALNGEDTTSDTGARIAMARWAWESFTSRPIAGVGVGSLRQVFRDHWAAQGVPQGQLAGHSHAHNTFLHILATTGLIGGALAVLTIWLALRNGMRQAAVFGGYDAGPLAALLGLFLAGAFDTIHVNSQTAALLTLLLSLCPAWHPPESSRQELAGPVFRGVGE